MRTLMVLTMLAACTAADPITLDGVAIADPTCEASELGCTVVAPRDGVVVLPQPAKPRPTTELYVHSASPDLGDAGTWRIAGATVAVARVSVDTDGSDVALIVPTELLAGPVAIEVDAGDTAYAFEVFTRVAGPNTTIPSGCTCNKTLHKIYCPRSSPSGYYTYCSSCCGY